MPRMLKTRPSPALVISLIALFVSLGGAGYAAVTVTGKNVKNNSLTGRDVKNSSLTGSDVKNSRLTGKDIKNRSLTGADIKNNSLSGAQVLESQLGRVPTATNADRAGSAAAVDRLKTVGSYKRVISSASENTVATARQSATEVPLFSVGPFDVYGKCFTDTSGPATHAEAFIRTHEDGSIFASDANVLLGSAYLDTGTGEPTRVLNQISASSNSAASVSPFAGEFFADAPGGAGINGNVASVAKNGTPGGGNGIYGAGNVCIFSGYVIG